MHTQPLTELELLLHCIIIATSWPTSVASQSPMRNGGPQIDREHDIDRWEPLVLQRKYFKIIRETFFARHLVNYRLEVIVIGRR